MQAGKTKQVRQETAGLRKALRPAARIRRAIARLEQRRLAKVAKQMNEDRKRAAAHPSTIAEVSAAYILQCANRRAEKAAEKAERTNATTPAEAETNEAR